MQAEIIAIGTELLMGEITDTNSVFIAQQFPALGITLRYTTHVDDDLDRITGAFIQALQRSDLIICSGGLGPTFDDLTREGIARAVAEERAMYTDPDLVKWLEDFFRGRGMAMPKANLRQAQRIPSAETLPNPRGTAPGWWVEKWGKIVVALPGPPRELIGMWNDEVLPRLKRRSTGQVIVTRAIKTLGLSEAAVGEMVAPLAGAENPYLGIYARPDGIHLRVIAKAATEAEARAMIRPVEAAIVGMLREHIWGYDEEKPEESIGPLLRSRGLKLTVMESLTGGMLASAICDVPGASDYFVGGLVTYATAAKIAAGVPKETVERHGAVSAECAEAMALAARKRFGADVAVAVTGVAGPSPQEGKAPGLVYTAIALGDRVTVLENRYPPTRSLVRGRAVVTALVELVRLLKAGG